MERFHDDDTGSDQSDWPSLWWNRVTWGAVLGLGFLIYEITARPTFGIAVACLKFGWPDFKTAVWLLKRDPHAGRGQTCFWFYLAFGLWKVTVAAFIVTGSLIALVTILGQPGGDELWHLGFTAVAGILLLAIVPMLGVGTARRNGVKVWIDGSIAASLKRQEWPPVASGFNALSGLLFPAMVVPILAAAILAFRLGGLVWVPISIFLVGGMVWSQFQGITAATPGECWEPLPPGMPEAEDALDDVAEFATLQDGPPVHVEFSPR